MTSGSSIPSWTASASSAQAIGDRRWVDTHIVDAAVDGVGAVTSWFGGAVRLIQTGKAQNYLLVGLVTVSVLLGAFLLLPK